MTFDDALARIEAASTDIDGLPVSTKVESGSGGHVTAIPANDPECAACGFRKHCHGQYSKICPVLVRGMLSMFRVEASDDSR